MLMTLTVSWDMSDTEQEIVSTQMMKGFYDMASQAGTQVTGGQTILNPTPIIGGVAMSVVNSQDIIRPCNAAVGDVILLTKPLGTQIAVNLFEWFYVKTYNIDQLPEKPLETTVNKIFNQACAYMSSLNRSAAELMHKYHAKACTDITGFGILGHAENLAAVQHEEVDFVINVLPCIEGVMAFEKKVRNFKLVEGLSAETSGGLLIVIGRENFEGFLEEFRQMEGREAWVVGDVVEGNRKARIENPRVIEV